MIESIIASPEVVHYICKRFDIKMSKKLGQNFLIKRGIVDEIVKAADLQEGEPVLEIGPGIGTLTQGLAQSGANVTAIELDTRLLEVLDKTLAQYSNVTIVHGDVIVLDVPPKSFLPAPAVTSSVIRCVLRDKPPVDVVDEKLFFRVVKAGFAQRRKTFANTMKTTGLSKDRIEELLAKANIDGQRRGETFNLQEFADVANAWAALIK